MGENLIHFAKVIFGARRNNLDFSMFTLTGKKEI